MFDLLENFDGLLNWEEKYCHEQKVVKTQRYQKEPEVHKYCVLAAKFTLQSPILARLQQAR